MNKNTVVSENTLTQMVWDTFQEECTENFEFIVIKDMDLYLCVCTNTSNES